MTAKPTQGEIRARLQWAALHARAAQERRAAAAQRIAHCALAIAAGAALGIILAKAPANCAATVLLAEEQAGQKW